MFILFNPPNPLKKAGIFVQNQTLIYIPVFIQKIIYKKWEENR